MRWWAISCCITCRNSSAISAPPIVRFAPAAGFAGVRIERYGSLPRAPCNWLARWRRERLLEPLVPEFAKPFQTIVVER